MTLHTRTYAIRALFHMIHQRNIESMIAYAFLPHKVHKSRLDRYGRVCHKKMVVIKKGLAFFFVCFFKKRFPPQARANVEGPKLIHPNQTLCSSGSILSIKWVQRTGFIRGSYFKWQVHWADMHHTSVWILKEWIFTDTKQIISSGQIDILIMRWCSYFHYEILFFIHLVAINIANGICEPNNHLITPWSWL